MVVRDLSTQYYGSSLKVDVFHDLFPFVTFLGTLLIAVGIKRLIHYIPEILVALAVSITSPSIAVFNLIPRGSNIFTNLDAQFTAFMLHYIGFKVQRQGPIVSLPNGSIEVTTSCSTISLLTGIIPFITVILFVYPTNKIKKIYVCTGVILWSILFNAIRMSWLAFIVNQKDVIGFEYWHEGAGVNVLSNFNLLCVAGLTYQILNYSPKINQED
jgi:cyanoexosortase A